MSLKEKMITRVLESRLMEPLRWWHGRRQFVHLEETDEYKNFINSQGRRMILLNTPEHGNIGDLAIALAERQFLSTEIPDYPVLELTNNQCHYFLQKRRTFIRPEDIVLVHGGGYVGTLWIAEERMFRKILKKFAKNKIVVFPQTVYFSEDSRGRRELLRLKNVIDSCKDISLFVRDKISYDYIKSNQIVDKCYLSPDMVMAYRYKREKNNTNNSKVIFCMRNDKEKTTTDSTIQELKRKLIEEGYEILTTDTVVEKVVYQEKRQEEVDNKLKQLQEGALVITDRLHGMILSSIVGTPCIAMDNISGKVRGGYEWLKNMSYVKCINPEEISVDMIESMSQPKRIEYDADAFIGKFYELKKVLCK